MKTCLAIPARLNSSRLPNKLLLPIGGIPVLQHTIMNAKNTRLFDEIILVTDHPKLAAIGNNLSIRVEMETGTYRNGTERIATLLPKIDADIVVNLQADELELPARFIDTVLEETMKGAEIVSAMYPIFDEAIAQKDDVVKVVCSKDQHALYFSRAQIPFCRLKSLSKEPLAFGHCGIYSFQRKVLQHIASEPACNLEESENLEQLRALYLGYSIKMLQIPYIQSINTPEDLQELRERYDNTNAQI